MTSASRATNHWVNKLQYITEHSHLTAVMNCLCSREIYWFIRVISQRYTASLNDNTRDGMNTAAGRTQDPVKPTQLPEIQTFLRPGYPIFTGDCDSSLKVELDCGKNRKSTINGTTLEESTEDQLMTKGINDSKTELIVFWSPQARATLLCSCHSKMTTKDEDHQRKPPKTNELLQVHRTQDGYITTTVHYLDNNWTLQTRVLDTNVLREAHNEANLGKALKNASEQWDINKKKGLIA